jgi:hypothetical protein
VKGKRATQKVKLGIVSAAFCHIYLSKWDCRGPQATRDARCMKCCDANDEMDDLIFVQ